MDSQEEQLMCPLCQANNYCGVNDTKPCWCMAESIPKPLLEKVPPNLKNKACICKACVEKFNLENAIEIK